MRLFKKNSTSIGGDAIAGKIARNIIGKQQALATYLNRKTKGVSGKLWLAILISFCAAFGSYCTFLIIRVLV